VNAVRGSSKISGVKHSEQHSRFGALFKEFILGGQDGLVNVLGVVLGVAVGTSDLKIIIIAGLAAAFAESFSMAAVAYTSVKAEEDYYNSQLIRERYEVDNVPKVEEAEVRAIYYKKGFRGKLLNDIVKYIVSNKDTWVNIMMKEELGLTNEFIKPYRSALVVGLAALIGSFIPLTAFFFVPIQTAIYISVVVSALALFITGMAEAKINLASWWKKGLELMLIGMSAAAIGFAVGKIFGG